MANANGAINGTKLNYYSGFCKNDNSACYLSVLQSSKPNNIYDVFLNSEAKDLECFAQGHELDCNIDNEYKTYVKLNSTKQYRTAVIKFKKDFIRPALDPVVKPTPLPIPDDIGEDDDEDEEETEPSKEEIPKVSESESSLPPLKSNETYSIKSTVIKTLIETMTQSLEVTITVTSTTEYTITNSSLVESSTVVNLSFTKTSFVETTIIKWVQTTIETFSNTSIIFISELEGIAKNKLTSSQVILISVIVIFVLFTLAIIGITLWRKSSDDSDSYSVSGLYQYDLNKEVELTPRKVVILDEEEPDDMIIEDKYTYDMNSDIEEDLKFLHGDF